MRKGVRVLSLKRKRKKSERVGLKEDLMRRVGVTLVQHEHQRKGKRADLGGMEGDMSKQPLLTYGEQTVLMESDLL